MTRFRRERGAAAVEFALLLPLLMVLLVAIMEFGYAFFIQASVAGAARVGVRSYAINWNDKDPVVAAAAKTSAITLAKLAVPDANRVETADLSSCSGGAQTTLVLTYKYHSMTGLLDPILGEYISLSGKGSMQCGG